MGKTIFISREESKAQDFIDPLERLGANILPHSLITFELRTTEDQRTMLAQLNTFDWIVFTSANGVKFFYETLDNYHVSKAEVNQIKKAVVGKKTQQFLEQYDESVDFVPNVFDAEHFSQTFVAEKQPTNVLLVKGNLSRKVIDHALSQSNISFKTMTVYNTVINREVKAQTLDVVKRPVDAWVFTSPSSIQAFEEFVDLQEATILEQPCFCIGHTTEEQAKLAGFKQTIVPREFTLEGLAEAVTNYYS